MRAKLVLAVPGGPPKPCDSRSSTSNHDRPRTMHAEAERTEWSPPTARRRSYRDAGRDRRLRRSRRSIHRAGDTGNSLNTLIQRDEGKSERLGQSDIGRVVTREIRAQLPDARRQNLIGPQVDGQVYEIGMGLY